MSDDSPTVTIRRRTIGAVVIVILVVAGALVGGIAIGRHSVGEPHAQLATSPSKAATTTTASTIPPATTTTTMPVTGPTLATCTAAITGYYFPGQNPSVQFGGLSTVQAVGYGCENQVMLSDAMQTAGDGTVYNGDVITVAQDVCNDYPNSPLCVNG